MSRLSISYGLRHGSKINCPLSPSPPEGEGRSAQATHSDLIATLRNEAVACSTMTKHLCTAQLHTIKIHSNPDTSSPHLDDSDRAILAALEEKSFSSVHKLARATHLPPTTVHRRLINSLGCLFCHLRRTPHLALDAHNLHHIQLCPSVLRMLQVQEQRAWHDVVLSPWMSRRLV
jgi:AraC-like DNA-binding protein